MTREVCPENGVRSNDLVSEAWGEWVAGLGEWHVFGGLTYRQAPVVGNETRYQNGVPHPEAVVKHVRSWLRESSRRIGRPVEAAVVAVESHKSGWPHCHPLVRLAGGLQYGDLAAMGQAWYERRGYARLEAPRGIDDVCRYAAKYLSKDLSRGDVVIWPQRGPLDRHQPRLQEPARARRGR